MMNENSPICASPIPIFKDVRVLFPARKLPSVLDITLPATTTTVIIAIGKEYFKINAGSIKSPIETKILR